ncbi:MAG: TetR/AcrR family transcriptional regulator [Flavobacteriales bacterium]|nr:TetR/AcrR family transcriptional regulator [Flavobacteriales bacterium]
MGRRPLNKIRSENPERRKKWILQLIPVFSQQGFSKFTMDEMAQLIGVSKATFYKYFSSKEQLIEEIISHKLNDISQFKGPLTDNTIPFEDRLLTAIEASASSLRDLSTIFLHDLKEEFPGKWKMIDDFKNISLMFLREFYTQAKQEGLLGESVSPDAVVVMDRLIFSGISDPELLKKHNMNLREFYIQYFTIKFGGIMSPDKYCDFKLRLEALAKSL